MTNLERHLDFQNETDRVLLAGLQGNILKGHGRQHSANIFINITGDVDVARSWISKIAADNVTTALQQVEGAKLHRCGGDAGTFTVLALSYSGYKKLGIKEASSPSDKRFRYGMKAVRNSRSGLDPDYVLQDIPVNRWESHYQSALDFVVVLADDNSARLEAAIKKISHESKAFGIAHVEQGSVLRRNGAPIEHFGFVDGISQPLFFQEDIEKEKRERGAKFWDPEAPLKIVLTQDYSGASSYGSYLVFRKLEQNVRGFNAAVASLATATFRSEESAAALVVGRSRDGKPLIPTSVAQHGALPNDFQYDKDVYGLVCPYHAHIRKVNPRGDILRRYQVNVPDLDFLAFERNHRLARRGVTYGLRPDLTDANVEEPSGGVGLLFMAYTSSIFSFEQLQTAIDDENFVTDGIGIDALAGYQSKPMPQRWPTPNANLGPGEENKNVPARSVRFSFGMYVTLKGGEYFYSPSVSFLKTLDYCGKGGG